MSESLSMREIDALGVVIPSRRDGIRVQRLITRLLEEAARLPHRILVVLADDGENGTFGDGLPESDRLLVTHSQAVGPGAARARGTQCFSDYLSTVAARPTHSWIVSLDADVEIPADFLATWWKAISSSTAEILSAPAHFGAGPGETPLREEVDALGSWLWSDTFLYERFLGIVNLGGSNHAISLERCAWLGGYLQPTAIIDGERALVAGDDWDFGLRARIAGYMIEPTPAPVVIASPRRIVADPVGFLAGRSYEGTFAPVSERGPKNLWPPTEPWNEIAGRGRARIVAHFLLKPLIVGIEPTGTLEWLIGDTLSHEVQEVIHRAPPTGGEWNEYRTQLIAYLFTEEIFALCGRIAQYLAGSVAP
jgi:hypothetical protein